MSSHILEEQTALCQLLLDNTREAFAVLALDHSSYRLLWTNRACRQLLGIASENRGLGAFCDYLLPVSAELFKRAIVPALLQGEDWQGELEARENSDSVVFLWGRFDFLPTAGAGEVVSVLVSLRDITRQRASKRRVCHQRKEESLQLMAGSLVHRYSNILAVVLGNLELASEELLPSASGGCEASVSKYLHEALVATEEAAKLGSVLRSYLGSVDSRRTIFPLHHACRHALAQSHLSPYTEKIVTAFAKCPPLIVSANFDQVSQLVVALLLNAIEATEAGAAVLLRLGSCLPGDISETNRFPIDQQPPESTFAFIEVSDSGPGISPSEIERIFDPFYSTKFFGRGLGLAVVLTVVRAHHGLITVDSPPGNGTVFRVYFPLVGGDTSQ